MKKYTFVYRLSTGAQIDDDELLRALATRSADLLAERERRQKSTINNAGFEEFLARSLFDVVVAYGSTQSTPRRELVFDLAQRQLAELVEEIATSTKDADRRAWRNLGAMMTSDDAEEMLSDTASAIQARSRLRQRRRTLALVARDALRQLAELTVEPSDAIGEGANS